MEGLHKQALRALSQVQFAPAPNEHELITIANPSDPQPTRVSLPLPDILTKFQESSSPLPAIRLVKLHITHPPLGRAVEPIILNAAKNDILQLWEQFEMDASLFHVLSKGVRGFYQHHSTASPTISPSGPNSGTNRRTHFVICSYTYCLAWTYSQQTQITSGVMILRPGNHLGRIDFEEWFQALEMQIPIARHPLCLFLVSTMQTMHLATVGAQGAQSLINDIEWRTGFYPWTPFYRRRFLNRTTTHDVEDDDASSPERRNFLPSSTVPSNMTLDELSLSSRNIGAILVFMEDHFRQIKALQTAADAFAEPGVGVHDSSALAAEEESIRVALRLLRQQMDSAYMRLNYLRERGKNQLTVVCLSHFVPSQYQRHNTHTNRT